MDDADVGVWIGIDLGIEDNENDEFVWVYCVGVFVEQLQEIILSVQL